MQQPVELQLAIEDSGSSEERLQELTMEFAADLQRERGVTATVPEAEVSPVEGRRGAGMEIGKLVVQLVSSGSAAALINVLATHFMRRPKMTVTVSGANGSTITLSAENSTPDEIQEMLRRLVPAPEK